MSRRRPSKRNFGVTNYRRGRQGKTYSDYINFFCDLIEFDQVALWLRVSGRTQNKRRNLDDQEAFLRQALKWFGIPVVAVFRRIGPGWDLDDLGAAIEYVRELGDTPLLAGDLSRFIRHPDYHSKLRPNLQPTMRQMAELGNLAGDDVILMTHWEPDSPNWEVRGYQTKRGQVQKSAEGGGDHLPGHMRRRRDAKLDLVLKLHQTGYSLRQIEQATNVPYRTVWDWLRQSD